MLSWLAVPANPTPIWSRLEMPPARPLMDLNTRSRRSLPHWATSEFPERMEVLGVPFVLVIWVSLVMSVWS